MVEVEKLRLPNREKKKKGDYGNPGILVNVRRLNVIERHQKKEWCVQRDHLAVDLVCGEKPRS